MPASSSVYQWNLTIAQGSAQNWNVGLTIPSVPGGVAPFPIDPAAWQYVARTTTDDGTGTPLISVTPAATSAGQLTITTSASLSQVNLQLYAPATQSLEPGTYSQTLWEYPGTNAAFAVFTGSLVIFPAAQP